MFSSCESILRGSKYQEEIKKVAKSAIKTAILKVMRAKKSKALQKDNDAFRRIQLALETLVGHYEAEIVEHGTEQVEKFMEKKHNEDYIYRYTTAYIWDASGDVPKWFYSEPCQQVLQTAVKTKAEEIAQKELECLSTEI